MGILKKYEVVNGKWNAPNLNIKTNAENFDVFINMHRQIGAASAREKKTYQYITTNSKKWQNLVITN